MPQPHFKMTIEFYADDKEPYLTVEAEVEEPGPSVSWFGEFINQVKDDFAPFVETVLGGFAVPTGEVGAEEVA